MTRLVLSPQAARDLEDIGDYIARDNPVRAISFVKELRVECQRILFAPTVYPPREAVGAGIRMAMHGRYLIFFRATEDEVRIERVLHSARQRPRL